MKNEYNLLYLQEKGEFWFYNFEISVNRTNGKFKEATIKSMVSKFGILEKIM